MKLKRYYEIIGVLTNLKHDKSNDILSISTHWNVELPKNAISKDKIKDLVGTKIGVFNAGDGRYKIRSISNKKVRGKSPW